MRLETVLSRKAIIELWQILSIRRRIEPEAKES